MLTISSPYSHRARLQRFSGSNPNTVPQGSENPPTDGNEPTRSDSNVSKPLDPAPSEPRQSDSLLRKLSWTTFSLKKTSVSANDAESGSVPGDASKKKKEKKRATFSLLGQDGLIESLRRRSTDKGSSSKQPDVNTLAPIDENQTEQSTIVDKPAEKPYEPLLNESFPDLGLSKSQLLTPAKTPVLPSGFPTPHNRTRRSSTLATGVITREPSTPGNMLDHEQAVSDNETESSLTDSDAHISLDSDASSAALVDTDSEVEQARLENIKRALRHQEKLQRKFQKQALQGKTGDSLLTQTIQSPKFTLATEHQKLQEDSLANVEKMVAETEAHTRDPQVSKLQTYPAPMLDSNQTALEGKLTQLQQMKGAFLQKVGLSPATTREQFMTNWGLSHLVHILNDEAEVEPQDTVTEPQATLPSETASPQHARLSKHDADLEAVRRQLEKRRHDLQILHREIKMQREELPPPGQGDDVLSAEEVDDTRATYDKHLQRVEDVQGKLDSAWKKYHTRLHSYGVKVDEKRSMYGDAIAQQKSAIRQERLKRFVALLDTLPQGNQERNALVQHLGNFYTLTSLNLLFQRVSQEKDDPAQVAKLGIVDRARKFQDSMMDNIGVRLGRVDLKWDNQKCGELGENLCKDFSNLQLQSVMQKMEREHSDPSAPDFAVQKLRWEILNYALASQRDRQTGLFHRMEELLHTDERHDAETLAKKLTQNLSEEFKGRDHMFSPLELKQAKHKLDNAVNPTDPLHGQKQAVLEALIQAQN